MLVDQPFSDRERRWQQYRHGRYVEFNLMYDEGTKFGLNMPNANVEAILMSLPRDVRFESYYTPEENSAENAMLTVLRKPRDWLPPTFFQNVKKLLGF